MCNHRGSAGSKCDGRNVRSMSAAGAKESTNAHMDFT